MKTEPVSLGLTPSHHFDEKVLHLEEPKWRTPEQMVKDFLKQEKPSSESSKPAKELLAFNEIFLN